MPELFKHGRVLLESDEGFGLNMFQESISIHVSILVYTVYVCVSLCGYVHM